MSEEEQKESQEDPICPMCGIWRRTIGETMRRGLFVWMCDRCDWGQPIKEDGKR